MRLLRQTWNQVMLLTALVQIVLSDHKMLWQT